MRIIVIIFFISISPVYGQTDNFKVLLDSAKAEFKKDFEIQDYGKAANYLEKAVSLNPRNSEARYFLGYAYSRLNSKDGRSMIDMNLDLVKKSSEQFESVIKLTPKYDGELVILDPYSKISSEWGSLAMSFWHNSKPDSAIWAFNQGKRAGGFKKYHIEVNRKVLNACSPNSILISSGDSFTILLWYLQIAEGFRKDVSVIDISLLNSNWYPSYLSNNKVVSFDLPKTMLDTLDYCMWKDSTIKIKNFKWTIKPSYVENYLLRGDRIFLSLLKKNNFQREIFFTTGFEESYRLSLKEYLKPLFVVDKLMVNKSSKFNEVELEKEVKDALKLSVLIDKNSFDELQLLDILRYNIYEIANIYLKKNDKKGAKRWVNLIDEYCNEKSFPLQSEEGKMYSKQFRKQLQ